MANQPQKGGRKMREYLFMSIEMTFIFNALLWMSALDSNSDIPIFMVLISIGVIAILENFRKKK